MSVSVVNAPCRVASCHNQAAESLSWHIFRLLPVMSLVIKTVLPLISRVKIPSFCFIDGLLYCLELYVFEIPQTGLVSSL